MISDHTWFHESWSRERVAPFYNVRDDIYIPPIIINSSGNSRWAKPHTYHRDVSETFGVEYVQAGNAVFVQDGKRYSVHPGEVFILRLGTNHTYGPGSAGYLLKRYVSFDGSAMQQVAQATGLAQCDYVRPLAPDRIEELIRKSQSVLRERPAGFAVVLSCIAWELCIELARSIAPQLPAAVRDAIQFIQKNLDRPLRAEEIFGAAGLSQTHCNRLFRAHVRMSPVKYHLRQRMAWARHLLGDTQMSIKEIAVLTGYDDPLYFSAQFKKEAGMSPKHFRQRYRQNLQAGVMKDPSAE